MSSERILGVVAQNSPQFVGQVFSSWGEGAAVVILRSANDRERLQMAGASEVLAPATGHGWFTGVLPRNVAPDAVAQISFTSGTEGRPKGVVLTHANLDDMVTRLCEVMHLTSEIREYVGVPVYHSFGFGRCRAIASVGGRAFLPERGFNPVELNNMLEAGEINAISAVPSLWRILLQSNAVSATAARRVRWIEIGSQYMSRSEKQALCSLFCEAIIVQHYGLTEASRTTFLEVQRESSDHQESVGRALGQVEVRIGADERIQIRGPHVASHLIVDDQRVNLKDADGWFVTNDRGALKDGYLYFLGRSDDVINCSGLKLAPDVLEAAMTAELGNGIDFVVARAPDPIRGDGILIGITNDAKVEDSVLIEAAANAALLSGVNARGAIFVLRVAELPRTNTGKVKRRALTELFVERSPKPDVNERANVAAGSKSLRAEIAAILGVAKMADGDTFVSLGGDSLRFIQASVCVQRALGRLPQGWEYLPIAQIEALPKGSEQGAVLEPAVLLRAVAIVAIVTNHSGALEGRFVIDGAAFLLLLPAGYSFARFQMQRVLESGKPGLALAGLQRIIIPTMLLALVQQLRNHQLFPSAILLYNNFVRLAPTSFWFIEVLVQVHVILALVLSLKPVRNALRDHAYNASLVALGIGAALRLGMPYVWNTDHLFNLVPHMALWHFTLGWCIFVAKQPWQRWLNAALIVALALNQLPYPSRVLWIVCGGMILNFCPPLRLPKPVVAAITVLGSASLYIYLSHGIVFRPFSSVFPSAGHVGEMLAAVLVGIGFWYVSDLAWQWFGRLRAQRAG